MQFLFPADPVTVGEGPGSKGHRMVGRPLHSQYLSLMLWRSLLNIL